MTAGDAFQDLADAEAPAFVDRPEELERHVPPSAAHPANIRPRGPKLPDEREKGLLDPGFEVDGDEGSHGITRHPL